MIITVQNQRHVSGETYQCPTQSSSNVHSIIMPFVACHCVPASSIGMQAVNLSCARHLWSSCGLVRLGLRGAQCGAQARLQEDSLDMSQGGWAVVGPLHLVVCLVVQYHFAQSAHPSLACSLAFSTFTFDPNVAAAALACIKKAQVRSQLDQPAPLSIGPGFQKPPARSL